MARYMFSRGWPVIEKQDEITKQRRERKGERDRQTNRERELAVEQANDQVSPPCHPPPPPPFFLSSGPLPEGGTGSFVLQVGGSIWTRQGLFCGLIILVFV